MDNKYVSTHITIKTLREINKPSLCDSDNTNLIQCHSNTLKLEKYIYNPCQSWR